MGSDHTGGLGRWVGPSRLGLPHLPGHSDRGDVLRSRRLVGPGDAPVGPCLLHLGLGAIPQTCSPLHPCSCPATIRPSSWCSAPGTCLTASSRTSSPAPSR